jgi:ribosomal protein L11 methyltransferase
MGARSVLAVDPIRSAVEATKNNARLNKAEDIILPVQGKIDAIISQKLYLVMANLYGDLLLDLADDISCLLETGSCLLLSGVAFEYNYEVKTLFTRTGCRLLKDRMLEEYSTLVFTASQAHRSAI